MKKLSYLVLLLLFTHSSYADMYKWKDKEGNIIYSDKPPFEGAEKLDPPGLTTTPAIKVPKKQIADPDAEDYVSKKPTLKYSQFKITSPSQDATIRSNPGNISVSFDIKPPLDLKRGHYLSIKVDGTVARDKVSATSGVMLENVDRGTHSISAIIKDKQGKVLKSSNSVTIHLHRQSLLHKKP